MCIRDSPKGRKVDPSAVPPTFGNAALLADGESTLRVDFNRRFATIGPRGDSRSVLPFIAGALRRSLLASPGSSRFGPEAHGSIRSRRRPSLHQPLVLYAGAGKYSSRSQPVFECGGSLRAEPGRCQTGPTRLPCGGTPSTSTPRRGACRDRGPCRG